MLGILWRTLDKKHLRKQTSNNLNVAFIIASKNKMRFFYFLQVWVVSVVWAVQC